MAKVHELGSSKACIEQDHAGEDIEDGMDLVNEMLDDQELMVSLEEMDLDAAAGTTEKGLITDEVDNEFLDLSDGGLRFGGQTGC